MTLENPLLFLGKQADTDVVKGLLRELKLDEYVSIKRGDTDAYLSNFKKGVCLLFESERYIHSNYGKDLPSEAPVLVAIFVYGRNHDEFSQFTNKLINGLLLSDGQEKVREKLGKSEKFNEDFNAETWKFPSGLRLFVDYSEKKDEILSAQYGVDLNEI